MERRRDNILVVSAVFAIVFLAVNLLITRDRPGLLVLRAVPPYLAIVTAISLITLVRGRLALLAQQEERDREIERHETSESIFSSQPGDFEPFTAASSRAQFERFATPAAAPLLALWTGLWAWRLLRFFVEPGMAAPDRDLVVAALMAFQAFALFLPGRYLLALGRAPATRLLRSPGIALATASLALALSAGAAMMVEVGFEAADRIVAIALAVFLAALAIEGLLNTLGEIYRPRNRDGEMRAPYESRIARLVIDPTSWAKTVAQTLDYQFGFKVSETWFFRFMEKALLPLIVFQLLVLYGLTCLVFVQPWEAVILERFGKPVENGLLAGGFHAKLPWPFETTIRHPVHRVLTLHVGYKPGTEKPDALLWTVPHHLREDLFLVASHARQATAVDAAVPVNLLTISVPVEYRITNAYQYAYNHSDAASTLEQVAYRRLSMEAVTRDLTDMIGVGQLETARALRARIQEDADSLDLGVEVLFVGLQEVHPPMAVAEAFQSVVGAIEVREASILEARAYANRILPMAAADSSRIVREAEAYRQRRGVLAQAEADRFVTQLESARRSPRVFRARAYLHSLSRALAGSRKYIIGAEAPHEVLQFNFEDKLSSDLFDFSPIPDSEKGKDL